MNIHKIWIVHTIGSGSLAAMNWIGFFMFIGALRWFFLFMAIGFTALAIIALGLWLRSAG